MEHRASRDESWIKLAACTGMTDLFYPAAYERVDETEQREQLAKEICASCMVRETCLIVALERREKDGIWGGLNERERRRILRRGGLEDIA